jgi:peroxiredoxin
MKKMITILYLLAFCFSTSAVSPGNKAKDFTLVSNNGKSISLSDYKGKYVILEWFNHGCPFVRKHYDSNNMQKTQKMALEALGKDKVAWLSIVSSATGKQGYLKDSKTADSKLKEEKSNANFLLLDKSGEVGRDYGAKTTPQMVIINPEGTVVYNGAIDSISSADQSDIPNATNYVTNAINSINSGKKVSPSKTRPYGCSVKY